MANDNANYIPAQWEKITAVAVAFFIVGLISFLVIRDRPFADLNFAIFVRILLSLSCAILGAVVPGFLQVDLHKKGLAIRAGGALALFIVTFFFTPSVMPNPKKEINNFHFLRDEKDIRDTDVHNLFLIKEKYQVQYPPLPTVGVNEDKQFQTMTRNEKEKFGIIEIGASGIKPAILHIEYNSDKDRYNVEEKKVDLVKNRYEIITIGHDDRSAFHPDSIRYVAEDVRNYVDKFQTSYTVPVEHIYIVGSSSVAKVQHKEELKQAIHNTTGLAMDFVTAEQESKHVFNGVLKLMPKERDKRDQEIIVIDIGSGNIKGGYYDSGVNQIVTLEIPLGTKTFSNKVDQERRDAGFNETAQALREQIVQPTIRKVADQFLGLKNKPRVYLVGGIVWATSSLLSLDAPEYAKRSATGDQEVYTVMNFNGLSDVDRLYNRLVSANAAEQVFTNNRFYETMPDDKKEKRRRDIERIRDGIFTVDQLIGGLELLKALSLELEFNKRHVFFIQNTLYAWPLGYVREKIEKKNSAIK